MPFFANRALVVTAVSLALGAVTGRRMLDSMNDEDPAVLTTLIESSDAPTEHKTIAAPRRRLVVALLDGLTEEAFVRGIEKTNLGPGYYDFRATVDVGFPSLSRPVYHVLLTGVPQSVSGIRNNAHSGEARADNLPARVRASGGTVGWALETVPWFYDLFGAGGDYLEYGPRKNVVDDLLGKATGLVNHADNPSSAMITVVFKNPTLAILHATEIDHTGHQSGSASPAYEAVVNDTLSWLIELRDAHNTTPAGKETVWMIGSDHGHLPNGGHGGSEEAVRRTMWIGLWPEDVKRSVEIQGIVPAERLAPTFAAILALPPPEQALGEPLELPDRPTPSSPHSAARKYSVEQALLRSERSAHNGMAFRAAVSAVLLLALAAFVGSRKNKRFPEGTAGKQQSVWLALLGCALPPIGAIIAFVLLGPGTTLSAIRTHLSFLAHSTGALTLGALALFPVSRRCRAPFAWTMAAAAAFPALALVTTLGSMGLVHAPESLSLLLPASGLVPFGVGLGGALAWGAVAMARRRSEENTL